MDLGGRWKGLKNGPTSVVPMRDGTPCLPNEPSIQVKLRRYRRHVEWRSEKQQEQSAYRTQLRLPPPRARARPGTSASAMREFRKRELPCLMSPQSEGFHRSAPSTQSSPKFLEASRSPSDSLPCRPWSTGKCVAIADERPQSSGGSNFTRPSTVPSTSEASHCHGMETRLRPRPPSSEARPPRSFGGKRRNGPESAVHLQQQATDTSIDNTCKPPCPDAADVPLCALWNKWGDKQLAEDTDDTRSALEEMMLDPGTDVDLEPEPDPIAQRWVAAAYKRFSGSSSDTSVILRECAKWLALTCNTRRGALHSIADLNSACIDLGVDQAEAETVSAHLWSRLAFDGCLPVISLSRLIEDCPRSDEMAPLPAVEKKHKADVGKDMHPDEVSRYTGLRSWSRSLSQRKSQSSLVSGAFDQESPEVVSKADSPQELSNAIKFPHINASPDSRTADDKQATHTSETSSGSPPRLPYLAGKEEISERAKKAAQDAIEKRVPEETKILVECKELEENTDAEEKAAAELAKKNAEEVERKRASEEQFDLLSTRKVEEGIVSPKGFAFRDVITENNFVDKKTAVDVARKTAEVAERTRASEQRSNKGSDEKDKFVAQETRSVKWKGAEENRVPEEKASAEMANKTLEEGEKVLASAQQTDKAARENVVEEELPPSITAKLLSETNRVAEIEIPRAVEGASKTSKEAVKQQTLKQKWDEVEEKKAHNEMEIVAPEEMEDGLAQRREALEQKLAEEKVFFDVARKAAEQAERHRALEKQLNKVGEVNDDEDNLVMQQINSELTATTLSTELKEAEKEDEIEEKKATAEIAPTSAEAEERNRASEPQSDEFYEKKVDEEAVAQEDRAQTFADRKAVEEMKVAKENAAVEATNKPAKVTKGNRASDKISSDVVGQRADEEVCAQETNAEKKGFEEDLVQRGREVGEAKAATETANKAAKKYVEDVTSMEAIRRACEKEEEEARRLAEEKGEDAEMHCEIPLGPAQTHQGRFEQRSRDNNELGSMSSTLEPSAEKIVQRSLIDEVSSEVAAEVAATLVSTVQHNIDVVNKVTQNIEVMVRRRSRQLPTYTMSSRTPSKQSVNKGSQSGEEQRVESLQSLFAPLFGSEKSASKQNDQVPEEPPSENQTEPNSQTPAVKRPEPVEALQDVSNLVAPYLGSLLAQADANAKNQIEVGDIPKPSCTNPMPKPKDEVRSTRSVGAVACCKKGHPLQLQKPSDDGWACDGRFESWGCKSGITDYYQTRGMIRYECRQCDFDLCELCHGYLSLHPCCGEVDAPFRLALSAPALGEEAEGDPVRRRATSTTGRARSASIFKVTATISNSVGRMFRRRTPR